jgi:hypothetical protein
MIDVSTLGPTDDLDTEQRSSTAFMLLEAGYYVTIFYTVLGGALGLTIGNVGTGFLMLPLFGLCLFATGPSLMTVIQPIAFALCCGVSYLSIQLFIHSESSSALYVRDFGPWLLSLVIVQSLANRSGFLHRFAIFSFLIGLAILPFLKGSQGNTYARFGLEAAVGYSNPNAMAGWFGFCAVYFTIRGYVDKRTMMRIGSWLAGIGCLYVVTLTVSRGTLLAVAIAVLLASRHLLRGGFLPLFLLGGLCWIVIQLGIFDEATHFYTMRGIEETGRLLVWPLLIERMLESPLVGVGASHTGAVVFQTGEFITPHNGFLLIGVASGLAPLILFVAHWIQAAKHAWLANVGTWPDAAFHIPLLAYTLLIVCAGNLDFMIPWAIVSLAIPLAARVNLLTTLLSAQRDALIRDPFDHKIPPVRV